MGGRNEEMIGKALKGKRDRVYLQTKVAFGTKKNASFRREKSSSDFRPGLRRCIGLAMVSILRRRSQIQERLKLWKR